MKLGELQEAFSVAHGKLLLCATENGYGIRQKHLMRCKNCHIGKKNSVHKSSLAIDIRLTIDGTLVEYIENHIWEADYNMLHDYWDSLGGAPRIAGDLGHFSFKYHGMW